MKTKKLVLLFLIILATFTANAQAIDERLFGTWVLEGMSQSTLTDGKSDNKVSAFSVKDNIRNTPAGVSISSVKFPENTPLSIYIQDTDIGICTTDKEKAETLGINEKGTYEASDGHLRAAMMRGEDIIDLDFIYQIEGDKLTLMLDQPSLLNKNALYKRTLIYKKMP
jgi:hypothetical protein